MLTNQNNSHLDNFRSSNDTEYTLEMLKSEVIAEDNKFPKVINDNDILSLAETLKIDIREELTPPDIAWSLKNDSNDKFEILGTLGDFSLVIGKAKSKKSFVIIIAVSTALSNGIFLGRFKGALPLSKRRVLYFDTEQSKYHVQKAVKRICKSINIQEPDNLDVYHLRTQSFKKRIEIIEAVIYSSDDVGFVVIDGIRDLVSSINDEEQAHFITGKLLKWSEERHIHIVTVLHQNKGNNNARGHLGTELINKGQNILSVTVAQDNKNVSIVEAVDSRDISIEPFAFEIIDDIPQLVSDYQQRTETRRKRFDVLDLKPDQQYKILNLVFSKGESFGWGKLVVQIKFACEKLHSESIGNNKMRDVIDHFLAKGWLMQEKERAPYTLGKFENDMC